MAGLLGYKLITQPTTDGESIRVYVEFTDTGAKESAEREFLLAACPKDELEGHLRSHAKAWQASLTVDLPEEEKWAPVADLADLVGRTKRVD